MADDNEPKIISPRTLLATIGLLAFCFPIALIFYGVSIEDCDGIQTSISAYYHTGARDIFVGGLSALAFAFLSYKGYDEEAVINDRLIGILAAVLTMIVALYPTNMDQDEISNCTVLYDGGIVGSIHYAAAGALFVVLALFALFQFTKSSLGSFWNKNVRALLDKEKLIDNYTYLTCGCLILLSIAILITLNKFFPKFTLEYKLTFWMETFMIWTFAFAWLRKSKILRK